MKLLNTIVSDSTSLNHFEPLISIFFQLIPGHTGGGFRRNSVSDGADSLSRSASDSSVSNPGGSSHLKSGANGGANGSSNGQMLG